MYLLELPDRAFACVGKNTDTASLVWHCSLLVSLFQKLMQEEAWVAWFDQGLQSVGQELAEVGKPVQA